MRKIANYVQNYAHAFHHPKIISTSTQVWSENSQYII